MLRRPRGYCYLQFYWWHYSRDFYVPGTPLLANVEKMGKAVKKVTNNKSGYTHDVQLNQKEMTTGWEHFEVSNNKLMILDSPVVARQKAHHHQDENSCHHLKDNSSLNGYTVKLARE